MSALPLVYFSRAPWPLLSVVCEYELQRESGHFQCLSVNITFAANEWRPRPLLSALSRTIHSFPTDLWTEPQRITCWGLFDFVLLILLVRWWWGGDSHRSYCCLSLSLFTLIVCCARSLSLCSVSHICSFSLWTNFKGKSQRARCWLLRSWLNRGSGTTCWFGVCVYVMVHMLGSDPTNCCTAAEKRLWPINLSLGRDGWISAISCENRDTWNMISIPVLLKNTRPKCTHRYFVYESK